MTRPSPSAELPSPVVRVEYLVSAGDWRRDDEVPPRASPTVPADQLKSLGILGRVLVTGMINPIEDLVDREIITPYLWTLNEC